MGLKVLYVNVFREYVCKHYGTVCLKVQTLIPTEALTPVSTVFPLVITGHSPVHNGRITRCRHPYVELCTHFSVFNVVN